jgi:putative addiction module CopG family antidote
MSKTYNPGPEADAIIERQLAKGTYGTADEVVRASVQLLEEQDAELEELRKLIDEGDAAFERGDSTAYSSADEFLADIKALGSGQLLQNPDRYRPGEA